MHYSYPSPNHKRTPKQIIHLIIKELLKEIKEKTATTINQIQLKHFSSYLNTSSKSSLDPHQFSPGHKHLPLANNEDSTPQANLG